MKKILLSTALLVSFIFLLAADRTGSPPVSAAAPGRAPTPVGTAFTYQGWLELDGSPVSDVCDLRFSLWDDPAAGSQLGSQELTAQTITDGLFTVQLNGANEFSVDVFSSSQRRWLLIGVRCPAGAGSYVDLTPRQELTAAPYAQGLRLPLRAEAPAAGVTLYVRNTSTTAFGDGLFAETDTQGGTGVTGYAYTFTGSATGVKGQSDANAGIGVYGFASNSYGSTNGVWGETLSPDGIGVRAGSSGGGRAIYGFYDRARISRPPLYVSNGNAAGIAIHASQESSDAALVVTNSGTGDLLRAFGAAGGSNLRFRVTQSGAVYADQGYHCGNDVNDGNGSGDLSEAEIDPCIQDNSPADFAEMFPAGGALEAGDVLVIGLDGKLARSSQAYQGAVIGVYSTRPSYLGNSRFAGQDGYAPLAVSGIVLVKASAENGPIQPGDMLTTAGMAGYAMRCQGAELCFGRTIGKALQGLEKGSGLILMLVGLY